MHTPRPGEVMLYTILVILLVIILIAFLLGRV